MNSIKLLFTVLMMIIMGCQSTDEKSKDNKLPQLLLEKSKAIIELEGRNIRDLNSNGRLDIYEDETQPIESRVEDVLDQMTLEEKAGMMFINGAPVSEDGLPEGKKGLSGPGARMPSVVENMNERNMTHFNIWGIPDNPKIFASWYNRVQQLAEVTRLGIPITIASDPRHHFSNNIFSMSAQGFSQFCETLGFAAIGDDKLVQEFADIVR